MRNVLKFDGVVCGLYAKQVQGSKIYLLAQMIRMICTQPGSLEFWVFRALGHKMYSGFREYLDTQTILDFASFVLVFMPTIPLSETFVAKEKDLQALPAPVESFLPRVTLSPIEAFAEPVD